jgi:hypothetical protein
VCSERWVICGVFTPWSRLGRFLASLMETFDDLMLGWSLALGINDICGGISAHVEKA